ncbi:hypothetical protein [Pseudomonas chlororaphis]
MNNVLDFKVAALAAYKERQAKGEVELLRVGSPLLAAAEADPSLDIINPCWLIQTLASLPMWMQDAFVEVAEDMAAEYPAGQTPMNILGCVNSLLVEAEECGDLAQWLTKESAQ